MFPSLSQLGGKQGSREKFFNKGVKKMRKEENKPEAPERKITMGSLFDGIGGFPLAAVHNGIRPVWASEIEAFPIIEVTKLRFPKMIHVGDITKLNGAKLPPVDIICGGSPCQDCLWPVREPV